MKTKPPVFKKSIFGIVLAIILALVTLQRDEKGKSSFQHIDGRVISISNINEIYPGKDSAKFRFIQLNNYNKPFEVFVGKSSGDFKPKFEVIDNLKLNDSISVYFDENNQTVNEPVNRLVYFIDRGQEEIYIQGNSIKLLLYGVLGFCAILILLLIVLKKKGKII